MRPIAWIILLLLVSSAPAGAKEEKTVEVKPYRHALGVFLPLLDVNTKWKRAGIEVRRIRVFERHFLFTIRAASQRSIEAAEAELRDVLSKAGVRCDIERGAPLTEVGIHEVELLITPREGEKVRVAAAAAKPAPLDRKEFERAGMSVNMGVERRRAMETTRHGQPVKGWDLQFQPGRVDQFVKLVHNLLLLGFGHQVVARWDALGIADQRGRGATVLEIVTPVASDKSGR